MTVGRKMRRLSSSVPWFISLVSSLGLSFRFSSNSANFNHKSILNRFSIHNLRMRGRIFHRSNFVRGSPDSSPIERLPNAPLKSNIILNWLVKSPK